jgi:hypothetical protein
MSHFRLSFALVISTIFLISLFNSLNARIVDTIENEKVVEIYSNIELTCKYSSNEVNWRKLNGVKINNILTPSNPS